MVPLKVEFIYTGYCKNFKKSALRTAKWEIIQYPALCIYIEHPVHGKILFDTGYSTHVLDETQRLPYSLIRMLTPITLQLEDTAAHQLMMKGIHPDEIQYIIISHFHVDHIGGLKDFPKAKFIHLPCAYRKCKDLKGFAAVHAAFNPGLMPRDFESRAQGINEEIKIETPYAQFPQGMDIFGDGSIIAIDLPGHAFGQIGILLTAENGQRMFFIADASWTSEAVRNHVPPNFIGKFILHDYQAFLKTLRSLHLFQQSYPDVKIIPTHCPEIYAEWKNSKLKSVR